MLPFNASSPIFTIRYKSEIYRGNKYGKKRLLHSLIPIPKFSSCFGQEVQSGPGSVIPSWLEMEVQQFFLEKNRIYSSPQYRKGFLIETLNIDETKSINILY